jgi:hypothetical protein
MRLRRRAGWPIAPHMDEVYVDLHLLTEMVLLLDGGAGHLDRRVEELRAQLRERLEAQKKEIEHGPAPPIP